MEKQEVIRKMQQSAGGAMFITLSDFAKFMGLKDSHKVKQKYLLNLDRIEGKLYFIPDVATELMKRSR